MIRGSLLALVVLGVAQSANFEEQPEINGEFIVDVSNNLQYEVNGVARATMTMYRGMVYKISGPGTVEHPLLVSDTSQGGTEGSNAYNAKSTQDSGGLCICPDGEAEQFVKIPAVADGSLFFKPSAETPDQLWYNCYYHQGMGGSISILGDSNNTGGGAWAPEMNGMVCPWCDYTSYRHLIEVHAACMFSAFGVILPIGAFLAYTGFHKRHIFFQVTGVCVGVVGGIFAIVFVQKTTGHHLSNPHHLMGVFILFLAAIVQPTAILKKNRAIHHKNGAAIIGFGLMNIIFGIFLLGLDIAFVYFYALYVCVLLVVFVFDPLQMRAKRMIEIAEIKARGEEIAVDAVMLLRGKAHAQFPGAQQIRKKSQWKTDLEQDPGKITFVKGYD